MKRVVIQYKVKPNQAERNVSLRAAARRATVGRGRIVSSVRVLVARGADPAMTARSERGTPEWTRPAMRAIRDPSRVLPQHDAESYTLFESVLAWVRG